MPTAEVRARSRSGVLKGPAARQGWWTPVLIAAIFFCAVAPTLTWVQLHEPIENLNVATALEMRRGGPWLVPTLQGIPRLAKPPLTAWVTAAAIRPSTLDRLSSHDPAVRSAAYERLAWEVRWPALLAACLTIVATYYLGRALGDDRLGWMAATICGTTLLFLRHCRLATTDGQLALWVAVANLFLAKAVFRGERWTGCLGAGAALALVLMSKGPVGLAQTVLPFGVFIAISALRRRSGGVMEDCGLTSASSDFDELPSGLSLRVEDSRVVEPQSAIASTPPLHHSTTPPLPSSTPPPDHPTTRPLLLPALAGLAVMLIAGGWWYAWVATHHKDMGSFWLAEVSRVDADDVPPDPWYKHFGSLYLFIPWLVWLAAGAFITVRDAFVKRVRVPPAGIMGLLLLSVPLLVMSLVKDRFERYLAPLAPAGALLAAFGLWDLVRERERVRNGSGSAPRWGEAWAWAVALHWGLLVAIAVGFPVFAAAGRTRSFLTYQGSAWYSPLAGAAAAVVGVGVVVLGIWANRRWEWGLSAATAAVMLAAQAAYYHGHGRSINGRSAMRPVADVIWRDYPDADLYVPTSDRRNVPAVSGNDLSIHMNRPLRRARDMASVPTRDDRPVIWFISRPRRSPELPVPPPPEWKLLAKVDRGETRYLFVRERGKS